MTSVRALRLAIQLSRSPSGRLRLGLIVAGSALATVALLSMAAVPGVAARQRGRLAEQTLQRPEQGDDATFWADQQDEDSGAAGSSHGSSSPMGEATGHLHGGSPTSPSRARSRSLRRWRVPWRTTPTC